MPNSHHLEAIENFLGTELDSPEKAESIISSLPWPRIDELEDRLMEFESVWQPDPSIGVDTMHMGRAYGTLSNPKGWIGKMRDRDDPLNVARVTRALVYLPAVSVWLPAVQPDDFGRTYGRTGETSTWKKQTRVCQLASKLSSLRPFLQDGSLTIVPDRFYSDVCGWKESPGPLAKLQRAVSRASFIDGSTKILVEHAEDEIAALAALRQQFGDDEGWIEELHFADPRPSDMLLLAREEAANADLRTILDGYPFLDGSEELCSEDRYIWALRNAECIKYINPLNELNEDQVVQAVIGSSTLCTDRRMFELLTKKHIAEALRTHEMVWLNASVSLPGLNGIAIKDLVSVRQNEDCFNDWRTSLRKAIRRVEELQVGSVASKEARDIFAEEVQPIGMALEQKVKSRSLQSIVKGGAVTFASTAIANYALNGNPVQPILTGGLASTLKMAYEVLESRGTKPNKALFRMITALSDS